MANMWLSQLSWWLEDACSWLFKGPSMVSKDIIQLVHEDHNRLRCLYRQYQMPQNATQQKRLLALDIIRHSSMHSKKEDMVLHAALHQHTGEEGAAVLVSQHQHLENLMQQLLVVPVTDPSFDAQLHSFMLDVERHLQEEERELLPSLQKELSQEQLMQLGRRFEWVKLIAPSRPHAWAPKAPFLALIVNALLIPLDTLRDMWAFSGAPTL